VRIAQRSRHGAGHRTAKRALAAAVLTVLLAVTAGCGGSTPAPTSPGAAEPGRSPELTTAPAGTVTMLASQPEGMAYDEKTDILAVAVRDPNRLLLVQGATGKTVRTIALPGHARHLQMGGPGGPVLVPAEDSNTFVSVALPGGQTTQTPVGEYPHDAAQTASGRILVADERGGTLSLIEDGKVIDTFDQPTQPGGVAADGDTVAVVDVGAFTISTYDVSASTLVGTEPAGAGPTHLVADGNGGAIVADTRGNQLLLFGLDPLAQRAAYPLPGTPYGIAYDRTARVVWVTLTAKNEVVGLDVSGSTPTEVARYPTVRQPNAVAVDPATGRLWVASRTTGQLQTIDR